MLQRLLLRLDKQLVIANNNLLTIQISLSLECQPIEHRLLFLYSSVIYLFKDRMNKPLLARIFDQNSFCLQCNKTEVNESMLHQVHRNFGQFRSQQIEDNNANV